MINNWKHPIIKHDWPGETVGYSISKCKDFIIVLSRTRNKIRPARARNQNTEVPTKKQEGYVKLESNGCGKKIAKASMYILGLVAEL